MKYQIIVEAMQKQTNIPMDLADATLMHIAHKENIKDIFKLSSMEYYNHISQIMHKIF